MSKMGERCFVENMIKDVNNKRCWRGNLKSKNSILLFGDSHSAHFIPFFDILSKVMDFKYFNWAVPAEVPCIYETENPFFKSLVQKIPEFDKIVFAAFWRKYSTDEFNCLRRMFDRFLKEKKKVMLIGSIPKFPDFLQFSCPATRPKDGPYLKCDHKYSVKSLKDKNDLGLQRNRFLRSVASLKDDLFYWSINHFICQGGICSYYYKNVRLYSDNNHFSFGGLTLLTQDYLNNNGIPQSFKEFLSN